MKVVIENQGVISEKQVETSVIVVGRSKECDIVINSPNISRKHLEIKLISGKYFIRDLTKSNWISYNGEKVEKGLDIELFDFMDINLPDNYVLRLENDNDLEIESQSKKSKRIDSKRSLSSNLVYGKITKTNKFNKKQKKKKVIFISIAFVIGVYFVTNSNLINKVTSKYFGKKKYFNSQVNSSSVNQNSLSKDQVQKIENVMNASYELLDSVKLCKSLKTKRYCEKIFENRDESEGVVSWDNNELIIVFNKENFEIGDSSINLELMYRALVLLKMLSPSITSLLKLDEIRRVNIVIIDSSGNPLFIYHVMDIFESDMNLAMYEELEEEVFQQGNLSVLLDKYGQFIYGKFIE